MKNRLRNQHSFGSLKRGIKNRLIHPYFSLVQISLHLSQSDFSQPIILLYATMLSNSTQITHPRTRGQWRRFEQETKDRIVLLSDTLMRRFVVFADSDVGIRRRFQNKLRETSADEDNDSSEETVQAGTKKSLRILTSYIRSGPLNRRNSHHKAASQPVCCNSLRSHSTDTSPKI